MNMWVRHVEPTEDREVVLAGGTGERIEISLIAWVHEIIDGMIAHRIGSQSPTKDNETAGRAALNTRFEM
jgi:hypothetical protein